jgi:GT2 family glycosyltransferase
MNQFYSYDLSRGLSIPEDSVTKLSVSIVLYKTPVEDLRSALMDLKSTKIPTVVTVVDNSPTDELRTLAEQSVATYIHAGANRGFGAGHNVVLREKLGGVPLSSCAQRRCSYS